MDRSELEARREELRKQLRQAEMVVFRLQGALACIDDLLAGPVETRAIAAPPHDRMQRRANHRGTGQEAGE